MSDVGRVVRLARTRLAQEEQALRHMFDPLNQPSLDSDDVAIDLQSTAADIVISAPNRIVLNGGGGYIKIEGGNIELGTSGPASFKGGQKVLTGGGSASDSVALKKTAAIPGCPSAAGEAAGQGASAL